MAVQHNGNVQNQLLMEEHDGANNAKRVTIVGGGSGQATVTMQGLVTVIPAGTATVTPVGLQTLAPSPNLIGLVTIAGGSTITLSDPKGYIGLVTIGGIGTVTLADPKGFIGLTTTTLGASPAFIGIVTVTNKDRTITGNVTLSDAKTYIGLTTSTLGLGDRYIGLVTNTQNGLVTLAPSPNFIGLTTTVLGTSPAFVGIVTVAGIGTVTLSDPKGYIGLVSVQGTVGVLGNTTVLTRNAGTNKVLKSLPVAFATASAATIFVPSNTFYITQVLLNSNATVRLNIRSGATHLTGNASLGVNIFPGGGWVENGSPDSPLYIGLAAAAPIVVEKADAGGLISQIGGHITYFDE